MSTPDYQAIVRSQKTPELIAWTAGWKPGSVPRLLGEHELAMRKARTSELRGWLALALSTAALVVSVLAFLRK